MLTITYETMENQKDILDIINILWPILVGIVGLVIVLAKMHTSIEVLQEKVKVLYELWNDKNNN